jgi:hypothetical protein
MSQYYITYAEDEWDKGRAPMDVNEFVSKGLDAIAELYTRDWEEYKRALETPGVTIAKMDRHEHAMVMQYDYNGPRRKRLISRLLEAQEIRRKMEANLMKKYGTTNARMIRARGQTYPAPDEIEEQYGSVLPDLPTDVLRVLRAQLTGKNSQKTPRAQAQRDVDRALNNMGVRM